MNDCTLSRISARDRSRVGSGAPGAGPEYTPRTRSRTQSTVFCASSAPSVPSSNASMSERRNATAARGNPSLPRMPSAVSVLICAAWTPSSSHGTRTTSDSYG